jgi:multiple sugar transport system ATP-binding protein
MYVTHDQVEAMTMGDRVCVLRGGMLQQEGPPQELYDAPGNLFVASFIGSPSMNLVRARVDRANAGYELLLGEQRLAVPEALAARKPGLASYVGREVALGVRPESLEDAALGGGSHDGGRLRGQVRVTEALGAERLVHVEVDVEPVVTAEVLEVAGDLDVAVLDELRAEAARHQAVVVGRFGPYSRVAAGESVEMTVDTRTLHFFDLETGLALDA